MSGLFYPNNMKGYHLLHEGTRALSRVENNGIRVDVGYLDEAISKIGKRIDFLSSKLKTHKYWRLWVKRFGNKSKLTSDDQLAEIFFNQLGFTCSEYTNTGKPSTDETAIRAIGTKFTDKWLELKKWIKVRNTYLLGIKRETMNGFLHPFFMLYTTRTYRSSSAQPNFQNMPIRIPEFGKWIRRALIPRKGRVLIELDYSGVEVSIAACYHKDPKMIEYLLNPEMDMHRDMAAQCFLADTEDVSKDMRHTGKNMFVFPQFYGDWWHSCSRSMWGAIDEMGLELKSGKPLREHLESKGIVGLGQSDKNDPQTVPGTFEHHMKGVEDDFWNNRFKVYGKWKKDWHNKYLENGYFETLTGFRSSGDLNRKNVINYPVQGSAFHCLLWSLTRLVLKEIPRNKMKTKIVGQIHDSIIADVPVEEIDAYLELARDVMTNQIQKWAPWLIVPLKVEADISAPGTSWFDKKEESLDQIGTFHQKYKVA